jgi:hypothetical protein
VLIAAVFLEGLRFDLRCLVLRRDWNWSYCCWIIGSVSDVTYGVLYCGGTGIRLIAALLYGVSEM